MTSENLPAVGKIQTRTIQSTESRLWAQEALLRFLQHSMPKPSPLFDTFFYYEIISTLARLRPKRFIVFECGELAFRFQFRTTEKTVSKFGETKIVHFEFPKPTTNFHATNNQSNACHCS